MIKGYEPYGPKTTEQKPRIDSFLQEGLQTSWLNNDKK